MWCNAFNAEDQGTSDKIVHRIKDGIGHESTTKLLRSGSKDDLVVVINGKKKITKFLEIYVVSIFNDVFPEVFPGLSPTCDVGFVVNVCNRTEPISCVPYRMKMNF